MFGGIDRLTVGAAQPLAGPTLGEERCPAEDAEEQLWPLEIVERATAAVPWTWISRLEVFVTDRGGLDAVRASAKSTMTLARLLRIGIGRRHRIVGLFPFACARVG